MTSRTVSIYITRLLGNVPVYSNSEHERISENGGPIYLECVYGVILVALDMASI